MKKHLMMWAMWVALALTGCSSDDSDPIQTPPEPTKKPQLTVGECAVIPAEGGEFSVAFSVQDPIEGALADIDCPEDWVHSFRVEESLLYFVIDPYSAEEEGTREAVVTITYPDADDASFTVRQEAAQLPTGSFVLNITRIFPDEVNYTLQVEDQQMTYLIGKTTRKTMEGFATDRAFALSIIQGLIWSESGLETALKRGDITDGYFMFYEEDLKEQNYLYCFGASADGKVTTDVLLCEVSLPAKPVVTVTPLSVEVPAAGGEAEVSYTIENPIEGELLSVTPNRDNTWVSVVAVEENKIRFSIEANTQNVERTAKVNLSYRSTKMQELIIHQAPDTSVKELTFELEVVECHWNRVIVNCIPSDPEAYYIIDSIAKIYYDGEGDANNYANGQDSNIPGTDLWNPYRFQVLKGTQTNYVITSTVYSEMLGWDFYVYAYGVDKSFAPTAATSPVVKKLVTLPDDRPVIRFGELEASYPAQGADLTISYTIENPMEGGFLKIINEDPTLISNLDDSTEGVVKFTLAPNSATTEREAVLLFEYYQPDNEYVPVASAELIIRQAASL